MKTKNLTKIAATTAASALIYGAAFMDSAQAHPHEFVTMEVTAKFDFSGKISGLTYDWTFDEFFTAYAVEGQDANKNGVAEQEELDALLSEILGNIHDINYFTVFDKKGVVPKLANAEPIKSTIESQQLRISFFVPFQEKLTVGGEKFFSFSIYDDEFYIAMNIEPESHGKIIPTSVDNCTAKVDLPDPDEDLMAFAASLGKTESSGGGLGAAFAEWVTIKCK